MIIRPFGTSQLVITQPDHAALAGRLMQHWIGDGLPGSPRRDEILLAIREHDNGWREVDAAPIVDAATGGLVDFIHAPDAVRRAVWPRGVARLSATPYAAALVAQHALYIYSRFRADPEWRLFFSGLETARAHHLDRIGPVSLDDLLRDYAFLRLADLISLTFCRASPDPPKGDFGYAVDLEGDDVIVAPNPFGGKAVKIEISARVMPLRPFTSGADALETFTNASIWTLGGEVRG